jgi:hypothetical protein
VIVESTVMRPPVSPPAHIEDPHTSPTSTSKRPLSPSHEHTASSPTENGQDSKRRRLSTDNARGKRMFGALMGTLNSFQKQASKDSKLAKTVSKRAEIDARIKEKAAREKEEIAASRDLAEKERKEKEYEHKLKLETETVEPFPGFSGHRLMVDAVTEFIAVGQGTSFTYGSYSQDILSAVPSFT